MTAQDRKMLDIEKICVPRETPLRRVIEILIQSGRQIVLVVDQDRKLLGSFTDGDLRRSLLDGATLESSIDGFFNLDPITAPVEQGRQGAVSKMRERGIDQIPLIDKSGRVVGIESINPARLGVKIDYPVVIMAGGLGKRLHPITESIPKALVPIGGRPILEIIIERLSVQGFQNFIVAVHHMGDMIEDYLGDGSRWNVSIEYVREQRRLGTAGALALLNPRPTTPLLVTNCDVLTTTNFQEMLEYHLTEGAAATVGVREYSYQVPYGVMELSGTRLTRLAEKPEQAWFVNAGMYVLDPQVIDEIPAGQFCDMTDVLTSLMEKGGSVAAYMVRKYWIDIGLPEDLERARSFSGEE